MGSDSRIERRTVPTFPSRTIPAKRGGTLQGCRRSSGDRRARTQKLPGGRTIATPAPRAGSDPYARTISAVCLVTSQGPPPPVEYPARLGRVPEGNRMAVAARPRPMRARGSSGRRPGGGSEHDWREPTNTRRPATRRGQAAGR